jgi:protease-4
MSDDDKKNTSDPSEKDQSRNDVPEPPVLGDAQRRSESAARGQDESFDVWTEGASKGGSAAPKRESDTAVDRMLASKNPKPGSEDWERDIINRLAFASLNEQRRARRWGIFFKVLTFIYIGAVLFYVPSDWSRSGISTGPHTALVEVDGVIASDSEASADIIVTGLRSAFKDKNTQGVILRINSPGGSPVQAGYVYDEIQRLREKHPDTKVYAVIVDVCASGGYYIASAADEIYADKASLVGSIGVLMNGFGFVDALEKLGVERRLLTAGENKAMLDPFSPLEEKHKEHMQQMLEGVHQQFIDVVKKGRGDRLIDDQKIFSGLVWNGDTSVELGLVDALGSSSYVAREIIGAEKIVDFTPRPNYLDRFASSLGASFASAMVKALGWNVAGVR